jgi:hypothetical protein
MNGSMLSGVPPRIQVSAIKFQIPSTKIQKNPKSQYPMTKTLGCLVYKIIDRWVWNFEF